jgi:Mn2+/Fe2+ NRAMP family transporter
MQTGHVSGGWGEVGHGFFAPHFTFNETFTGGALIMLIMANIGTTITPWQIFFQQSAVVDKGMDVKDVKDGKIDTFFGALMTCVVAAFIIIAAAAVFHFNPDTTSGNWKLTADNARQQEDLNSWKDIQSAAQTAKAMPYVMPNRTWGQWSRVLFAIGLFDAGLLGALCISLATSWALGEVCGWAHSLNRSVRGAPWFYIAYVAMLLSAGAVTLVTNYTVQDAITLFVQVIAVTLLPAALVFLILLLNDKALMGKHVNTRWQNIANWSITIFVILMSTLFGLNTLFKWFG